MFQSHSVCDAVQSLQADIFINTQRRRLILLFFHIDSLIINYCIMDGH